MPCLDNVDEQKFEIPSGNVNILLTANFAGPNVFSFRNVHTLPILFHFLHITLGKGAVPVDEIEATYEHGHFYKVLPSRMMRLLIYSDLIK